ncbi:hypothetical protein AWH69_15040 [Janibacter melonis]|uniref:Uncharacterized protein n=2 Tax=Janibacter melonis TaxID=262209 RepID=A0A176Q957_9MICO|nr:hypothetical protein AWH69_15040 [Janibacter melonis]
MMIGTIGVSPSAQAASRCKTHTFVDTVAGALGSVGKVNVKYSWCWSGSKITSYRVVEESESITKWGSVRGYTLTKKGDWFKGGGKGKNHVQRMHRYQVGRDYKLGSYSIQDRDHYIHMKAGGGYSHSVKARTL